MYSPAQLKWPHGIKVDLGLTAQVIRAINNITNTVLIGREGSTQLILKSATGHDT